MDNSTFLHGTMTIDYAIEPQQIDLAGPARDWSFDGSANELVQPDPQVQGRIYRLGALIQGMVLRDQDQAQQRQVHQQQLHTIPVWIELRYPAGPVIVLFVLCLLVLLLLWLLAYWLARTHAFVVEDDAGRETVITPGLFQAAEIPSSDRRALVRLRS